MITIVNYHVAKWEKEASFPPKQKASIIHGSLNGAHFFFGGDQTSSKCMVILMYFDGFPAKQGA